jgi:hypothetical protein
MGRALAFGSPALAFAWQLWRRCGRLAAALALYGAMLALLARAPIAGEWRQVLLFATMPLGFGVLCFLAGFAFPEGDIQARCSGFPGWMLVLPARTWELAFWPMLHGALAAALCWVLPVWGILAPLGVPTPAWPAALAAALLATLQALLWTPFGLPYLRVALALLLSAGLVTAGVAGALQGVPQGVLVAVFSGGVGLAYGAAVRGLTQARRGEMPKWRVGRARGRGRDEGTGFASPLKAQIWCEWRSRGMALPLLVGVLGGIFSLPFLWVQERTPLLPGAPPGTAGAIAVNLWLKLMQPCLFALPLLGAVVGCGRKAEGRRELALPWFAAVRPLDDAALVAARFTAAARSAAVAWGIALFILTGWLLLPGEDGDRRGPLLLLLLPHLPRAALVGFAALAFLALWTVKNQVQGLWADVSGRPGIVHGVPLAAHGTVLAALVCAATVSREELWSTLWTAAIAWLLLKAVAATLLLRALRRHCLLSSRVLAALGAAWLLTAFTLAAALTGIAHLRPEPGSLEELILLTYLPLLHPAALPSGQATALTFVLFALLFLPLGRLAAAPLAMGWNRRR